MTYAIIAIIILLLLFLIIRAWNLPAVVEWRAKRAMKAQEERTKRVSARRRRWHKIKNDNEYYQNLESGMPGEQAESKHNMIWSDIENGDYDNVEIPEEKRWKWFRRNKARGDNNG